MVKNPPANAADIRDGGLIPGSGRSPWRGPGNPLPYSCLEESMDRGTWRATVYRVTKSWTQLKWLSMHACRQGRIQTDGMNPHYDGTISAWRFRISQPKEERKWNITPCFILSSTWKWHTSDWPKRVTWLQHIPWEQRNARFLWVRVEELKQVQNIPSGEYLIRGSRNYWQAGNKGWKAPSNYLYRLLQESSIPSTSSPGSGDIWNLQKAHRRTMPVLFYFPKPHASAWQTLTQQDMGKGHLESTGAGFCSEMKRIQKG